MKSGKFTKLMQAIREQRERLLPAEAVPPAIHSVEANPKNDTERRYANTTKAKAKVVAVAAHS
jgi:hypothetical protein